MTRCLIDRAECYLKLKDGKNTIRDCTTGLANLTKQEEVLLEDMVLDDNGMKRQQLKSRFLLKRGTAKIQLENDESGGLKDLKQAFELDPLNAEIAQEVEKFE